VARMSAPDRSDSSCMAGHCEPVVNGGSDAPPLHRRLARSMVPGY